MVEDFLNEQARMNVLANGGGIGRASKDGEARAIHCVAVNTDKIVQRDVSDRDRSEGGSLRGQMQAMAEAKRLVGRLTGQRLPEVELLNAQAMGVPLQSHVTRRAVIYFVPGDKDGRIFEYGKPTPDTSQHRGYVNGLGAFRNLGANVLCVSSQHHPTLREVGDYFGSIHLMLSDPEFLIGRALGVPSVRDGDMERYRRMTLVTRDGGVEKVFYPVEDAYAGRNARQVLTWIQANNPRGSQRRRGA